MKKKLVLLLIALFGFMLLPINTNAKADKVKIYLFRGQGCPHCEDFLKFLNDIDDEYANMFELESYEVWYNSTNRELMDNIASFLKKEVGGVPFIIIGDKTYAGYGSSYDSEIKSTIKSLYNTSKSQRYDVMTEYKKTNALTGNYTSMDLKETLEAEGIEYKEHKSSSNGVSSTSVILWNLLFTTISTIIIIVFFNNKLNKISNNAIVFNKKTTKSSK